MNKNDEKKVSAFKIACRIAYSGGLLLIVLAPLLWGLLPLGYTYIKQDPVIKDNPTFIVFMRMFCSFIVTTLFGLVIYLLLLRKKISIKDMPLPLIVLAIIVDKNIAILEYLNKYIEISKHPRKSKR